MRTTLTGCAVPGARGEADAQNITVLAMWMIEHPGTEDERDEPHGRGDGSDSCTGAAASAGGKSAERSSFLCSSGDPGTDTSEMEEGFSEGCVTHSFTQPSGSNPETRAVPDY